MRLPSGRRTPLAVRTITAFSTSPFFTRPRGIASLTLTTMVSPTSAYLRFDPPSTLMHITRRAPELSATSSSVVICIIFSSPDARSCLFPADPFERFPALQFRDRAALADSNHIADLELALLVMGVIFLCPPHGLSEHGMSEPAFDVDNDGLRIPVAYNDALQHAFRHCLPSSIPVLA